MKRVMLMLGCSAWLVFAGTRVAAQSYSLGWYTIDGGGGVSSGGSYTLNGTVGQTDGGAALSGGNYSLQGGFWPGIVVPSSGSAPTLFIQLSGNSMVLSWAPLTAGFELEASDDLSSPAWSSVSGSSPVTIPINAIARFYRLKQP